MDEEPNAEKSNNSAKRSKLDNIAVEENDTSTTNANDVSMAESTSVDNESTTVTARQEEDSNTVENRPSTEAGTSRNSQILRRLNRNFRTQLLSYSSSEDSDDNFNGDNESPHSVERERYSARSSLSRSSPVEFSHHSPEEDDDDDDDNDAESSGLSIDYDLDQTDSDESALLNQENKTNLIKDEIMAKPKPNYSWNLTYEIMYREHGLSSKGRHTDVGSNALAFQKRVYGARHTIEKLQLLHKLKKHDGCVNSLNFNKSGTLLASGSDDLRIILWNWASNKIAYSFKSGHSSNVFQTKFIGTGSENEINIVSSGRDGHVRYTTIPSSGSTKLISKVLWRHAGSVHKIAPSPQSPYEILTAGEDGRVIRCDLRDSRIEKVVTVKVNQRKVPLYSIAHNPLSQEFCVCGRDQFIRVYDKRNTNQPVHMMCPEHLEDKKPFISHITCAVYNSTGTEVLGSYSDDDIYSFDSKCYKPGEHLHRYRGHNNNKTIKGVNYFGLNSEYVISGSDCGNFFIWDRNTEAIINWKKADLVGVVNCLEPHPHFPVLATSGLEHDVKIWVPSNDKFPPPMEGLEKCVRNNTRRSAMSNTDLFDDRTFFFFVRQCLQQRRLVPPDNTDYPNFDDLVSSSGDEDGCDPEDEHLQIPSLPCTPQ